MPDFSRRSPITGGINWAEMSRGLREAAHNHMRDIALKAALQPHPWFWYHTSEAREERDLARWADDGGRV
jgi:hypothetical protein